jgi:hypothetical protein
MGFTGKWLEIASLRSLNWLMSANTKAGLEEK